VNPLKLVLHSHIEIGWKFLQKLQKHARGKLDKASKVLPWGTNAECDTPLTRGVSETVNKVLTQAAFNSNEARSYPTNQRNVPGDTTGSSSSRSSDRSSSGISCPNVSHRRRSHGCRRRRRHSNRRSRKEVNPKELAEYWGTADASSFYRFVAEGTHSTD
jgi:hypothetical protein